MTVLSDITSDVCSMQDISDIDSNSESKVTEDVAEEFQPSPQVSQYLCYISLYWLWIVCELIITNRVYDISNNWRRIVRMKSAKPSNKWENKQKYLLLHLLLLLNLISFNLKNQNHRHQRNEHTKDELHHKQRNRISHHQKYTIIQKNSSHNLFKSSLKSESSLYFVVWFNDVIR